MFRRLTFYSNIQRQEDPESNKVSRWEGWKDTQLQETPRGGCPLPPGILSPGYKKENKSSHCAYTETIIKRSCLWIATLSRTLRIEKENSTRASLLKRLERHYYHVEQLVRTHPAAAAGAGAVVTAAQAAWYIRSIYYGDDSDYWLSQSVPRICSTCVSWSFKDDLEIFEHARRAREGRRSQNLAWWRLRWVEKNT